MLKCFYFKLLLCALSLIFTCFSQQNDSLPKLNSSPQTLDEVWGDYNPEKEPMLTEIHKEWEEDGVVIRAMRYYIGTFKGKKAWMAGLYAFPKNAKNLPAILQSHGGGGSASSSQCVNFAKRGYAIFSLSWRVEPRYLKNYQLPPEAQTDWGGVTGDQIADARGIEPHNERKLDPFPSGRNEGYFLRTLAARRGITFLAQQPEVNPDAIGMTGHSMGGVITHQTSAMEPLRIKACAPSDGPPIKHLHPDSHNINPSKEKQKLLDLAQKTASPASYASKIKIPMLFLNSINDFHGHCEDVEWIIDNMPAKDYSIARTAHANHSHSSSALASKYLWFDAHLKGTFQYPNRPTIKVDLGQTSPDFIATLSPDPNSKLEIQSVDFYYSRDGENDFYKGYQSRIWKYSKGEKQGHSYKATIPVIQQDKPLWVYADIQYKLPQTYETYNLPNKTETLSSSSRMIMLNDDDLKNSQIAMIPFKPTSTITTFGKYWKKEWLLSGTNNFSSFKILDSVLEIPNLAKLVFIVECKVASNGTLAIGDYATRFKLIPGENSVELYPFNFKNSKSKEHFLNWKSILSNRPNLSFRIDKQDFTPKELRFSKVSQDEFNQHRPFRLSKTNSTNGEVTLNLNLADEIIRKHGDFHKNHVPIFTSKKGKKTPDYKQGILVRSGSEITFNLNQSFQKFTAKYGVHHSGSVTYEVWADGDKLFDSGKITSKSNPSDVSVDVSKKSSLRLVVTDAGNGYHGDAGMWVNPKLSAE